MYIRWARGGRWMWCLKWRIHIVTNDKVSYGEQQLLDRYNGAIVNYSDLATDHSKWQCFLRLMSNETDGISNNGRNSCGISRVAQRNLWMNQTKKLHFTVRRNNYRFTTETDVVILQVEYFGRGFSIIHKNLSQGDKRDMKRRREQWERLKLTDGTVGDPQRAH